MIGSLVSGALQLGSSIFGGISASKAMKKVKRNIQTQQSENESWYNRRYNEDATQRSDAQRVLTKVREDIHRRNQQAAGAQAVMGGTEESVAAEKAANNQAMAEAASQIAVAGDRRKDTIEQQYQARDAQLNAQLNDMEINKTNAISQAVQGVAGAASGLTDMIPDFGKRDGQ